MKKILSLILAVIMAATASLNAFAASAKKTYISDVVAVTAKDENDAKAQLEKEGYKLLGGNVNSTLKTGVYLGYKETENAEEAITDIAGMNMTGKFSYSDYEQIMKNFREQIDEMIENFLPAVAEFQENYENETMNALLAYEALNLFKDDDSGKLMGDYILEYDFSDEAQKKMTDSFLQANTQIILTVMKETGFASDSEDTTLVERMSDAGPDSLVAKYKKMYPTVAKANQALAAEYGTSANIVYNEWNDFYSYLCAVEKDLVNENSDGSIELDEAALEPDKSEALETDGLEAEAAEYVENADEIIDSVSAISGTADFQLYALLSDTAFGDGTLLDYFKRPANEISKTELYTFIDSMSEGQRSQLEISGLKETLIGAFSGTDGSDETSDKVVEDFSKGTDSLEPVSIYSGVDRSIFNDGIAFTSSAVAHEKLTGESWIEGLTGAETEQDAWMNAVLFCSVTSAALLALGIGSCFLQNFAEGVVRNAETCYNASRATFWEAAEIVNKHMNAPKSVFDILHNGESSRMYTKLQNAKNGIGRVGKVAMVVKWVSFALFAVAFIADIYAVVEYFTADEITEEKIPHHLLSAVNTSYGEDYVYYQTVKNLKGEAADTNNHEADAKIGWLVLYTTKDKAAGDPILADNLKLQTGSSDFREGTSFVHLFNEKAALNLTAELYTGVKDSANGTYLVFERDSSTLIGSAITNGTAAIIGVGGLAVGAVLGAVIAKLAGKKKKENPVEA